MLVVARFAGPGKILQEAVAAPVHVADPCRHAIAQRCIEEAAELTQAVIAERGLGAGAEPVFGLAGHHVDRAGDSIAPEQSALRSEEHTSELQSLMRNSYAVF